jgi:hypothetical protein
MPLPIVVNHGSAVPSPDPRTKSGKLIHTVGPSIHTLRSRRLYAVPPTGGNKTNASIRRFQGRPLAGVVGCPAPNRRSGSAQTFGLWRTGSQAGSSGTACLDPIGSVSIGNRARPVPFDPAPKRSPDVRPDRCGREQQPWSARWPRQRERVAQETTGPGIRKEGLCTGAFPRNACKRTSRGRLRGCE